MKMITRMKVFSVSDSIKKKNSKGEMEQKCSECGQDTCIQNEKQRVDKVFNIAEMCQHTYCTFVFSLVASTAKENHSKVMWSVCDIYISIKHKQKFYKGVSKKKKS